MVRIKMTTVQVETPDEWMQGWAKIYDHMLQLPNDQVTQTNPSYPVELFLHFSQGKGAGLKALELGCGGGDNVCTLAQQGFEVVGFDALDKAVELANRRIQLLDLEPTQAKVELGTMEDYPITEGEYDVIIAVQSLQYLFDKTLPKLRELVQAVKPGGWLIYQGNILPHKPTEKPIRFVTPEELREELQGWEFHCFGTEELLLRPGDLRGYVRVVARKPT